MSYFRFRCFTKITELLILGLALKLDLLPEQVGGKTVDYTTVAAAWEVQRRRMGLESEGEAAVSG